MRRVGFEIELAGLEPEELGELLSDRFGGCVEVAGKSWRVESAGLGRFLVTPFGGSGDVLRVTTPDLPLSRLPAIETLRQALRQAGAVTALAGEMHLYPEAPSLGGEALLRHLRAFLLLYDEIVARRAGSTGASPVAPFPYAYAARVMAADYAPSDRTLIEDYLTHNPTDARPLDLLPLFAYLEHQAGGRQVSDLVDPRPAFHYRTGCPIEDADWRIADEWNLWVQVESLAADRERLETMCAAYAEFLDAPLSFLRTSWRERLTRWL